MATILKGAEVVAAMNADLAARVEKLKARGTLPTLAIVRVGENPDDMAYERGATARCGKIGLEVRHLALPEDATQDALVETLQKLNADAAVHGVLLLRPLPKHMDDDLIRNTLAPEKDVDGITDLSLAGVFTGGAGTSLAQQGAAGAGGGEGYAPCTAQACIEILDHFGIDVKGKRAVVVGRSLTVGKPAAMLLLAKHATVTICHTRTVDMAAECRKAELLIVSAGRAGVVGADFLAPHQTVIDVGINVDEDGNLLGDVDFAAAESIVDAITPVPGGVGTVTTSVLAKHVVQAAEKT